VLWGHSILTSASGARHLVDCGVSHVSFASFSFSVLLALVLPVVLLTFSVALVLPVIVSFVLILLCTENSCGRCADWLMAIKIMYIQFRRVDVIFSHQSWMFRETVEGHSESSGKM
jgi:hypothetical protein